MEKKVILVIMVVLAAVLVFSVFKLTGQAVSAARGNCIDSDKGDDKYVKGIITFENRATTYTDECVRSAKLKEYYCNPAGLGVKKKEYACEKGCVDGACVK